jgi:chromate transport protein ChrA
MNTSEWINYLKEKLWVWILLGILVAYIFFKITEKILVIIGGGLLGAYMYYLYNDTPINIKKYIPFKY